MSTQLESTRHFFSLKRIWARLKSSHRLQVFLFIMIWVGVLSLWACLSQVDGWKKWATQWGVFSKGEQKRISHVLDSAPNQQDKGQFQGEEKHKFGRAQLVDLPFGEKGQAVLGNYHVCFSNLSANTRYQVDFTLEGKTVFGSKQSFQEFMDNHYRFFRDQVASAVRACGVKEMSTSRRPIMTRRIADRVNRAFGRDIVEDLHFKNLAVYQSVGKTGFVRMDPNELK